MSEKDFMISYTVKSQGYGEESDKRKARRIIKEINGWEDPHDDLETLLVGTLEVRGSYDSVKRNNAQSDIEDKISDKLKEHSIKTKVKVVGSLMVDSLGEHIPFEVK